jgi:hypothetical protein
MFDNWDFDGDAMGIGFKDGLNREFFAIESNLAHTKVYHRIYTTAGICGMVAIGSLA